MSQHTVESVPSPVDRLLADASSLRCGDEELLERFRLDRDADAFERIVLRHGAMVLGVCHSVLGNRADAEDVFQATFLILARKADSIAKPSALACWLHGVAYRKSLEAKSSFVRRRRHESHSARPEVDGEDRSWRDVRETLHEELEQLAECYRLPLVLCYLQGRTRDETADLLGLSKGTLKRRLERGRALLRDRLVRRGIGSALGLLTAAWPSVGSSAMVDLLPSIREGVAGVVSERVLGLITGESVASGLGVSASKAATIGLALMGLAALAVGLNRAATEKPSAPAAKRRAARQVNEKRVDQHGDALPPGVVARLGSKRFRSTSWIGKAVLVPGGEYIAGLGGRSVILWDTKTGKEVRRFWAPKWRELDRGGSSSVILESLAVSPDGKVLAAGTTDSSQKKCPILLFDVESGRKLGELAGHKGSRWASNPALEFVSKTKLVSGGLDGICRVWDVNAKTDVRRLRLAKGETVSEIRVSSDRDVVYLLGRTGERMFFGSWDISSDEPTLKRVGLPKSFASFAMSRKTKQLAVILGVGEIGKEGGYNEVRLYSTETSKELRRWRAHTGKYPQRTAVAFSPDAKMLATGGADHSVRFWSVETGKSVGKTIEPYQYANEVGFLDAETMFTFGSRQALEFWDVRTGKPKKHFEGAAGHLTCVAYSPDGRYVAFAGGGGDATVRVWEVAKGKQVAHLKGGMHDVIDVSFSPDGKRIVSADSSGTARIWDWRKAKVVRKLPAQKGWLHVARFDPTGKRLLTCDESGVIRIWASTTGKMIRECRGHSRHGTALVFSPDGKRFYSSSWDHSIRCWDASTGKQLWLVKGVQGAEDRDRPRGHTSVVSGLALSPGGNWLYSGSSDHRICVWDAYTGAFASLLKGQSRKTYSNVKGIALSPDGTRLAAALGDDGNETFVHVWDVWKGKKLGILEGHRGGVTKLAFSPDSRRLASASVDTTVLVWDFSNKPRLPKSVENLDKVWHELGLDSETAYAATQRARLAGDAVLEHLRPKLKRAAPVEEKAIVDLVKQLGSDEFDVRERATEKLLALGTGVVAPLKKLAAASDSVEAKTRAKQIISKFEGDALRLRRVAEVVGSLRSRE